MFNPPNDLTGTVAFVSGASRGLGRTYALALAKAGAKVFATARTAQGDPATQGSLAELEATGRAEGLDIAIGRMDLANTCDIEAAVTTCVERFGRLDTVVNNAVWTINRLDLLEIDVKNGKWRSGSMLSRPINSCGRRLRICRKMAAVL